MPHQEFSIRLIRREARVGMSPMLRMILEEGTRGRKCRPLANPEEHTFYRIRGSWWICIKL